MAQSLAKSYHSLKNRLAHVKEKSDHVVKTGLHTAEAAGTAFAFGMLRKRRKHVPKVFGVPLDLGAGVAGLIGGLMDVGGAGDHLVAIGQGALSAWAYEQGLGHNLTGIKGLPSDDEVANALP